MRPAPIEIELGYRSYWLVRLRWIFSSAIIWCTFVATSVVGLNLDPLPLYLIGAFVAVYNSLFLVALKLNEVAPADRAAQSARLLTNGQVVADLLVLTLMLHFVGGAENPISFYFVFHVIVASILLSRAEAFLQATLATLLYGGLLALEFSGVVPHVHVLDSELHDLAHDPQFVSAAFMVFASTMYSTSYLATSIVSSLRQRDRENRALTYEIETKTEELRAAYQSLAELEKIKSRQLSTISDEIRPHLVLLRGWLDNLAGGMAGEISPAQRDLIGRSARRTDEMLAMISNLRMLARATEVRGLSDRSPVNLTSLARGIVAEQNAGAVERGVVLSLEERADRAIVLGEAESLRQLLSHLVSNAVAYTLSGGTVRVSIDCPGEVVQVQVVDTGIGIPAADLSRVFDQFFRSENARRYRPEGAGLGLTIARSVAERHCGQIDLESRLGTGTTVTVLLPRGHEFTSERGDFEEESLSGAAK